TESMTKRPSVTESTTKRPSATESVTKKPAPAPVAEELDFTAPVTVNNPFGQGQVAVSSEDLDFTAQQAAAQAAAQAPSTATTASPMHRSSIASWAGSSASCARPLPPERCALLRRARGANERHRASRRARRRVGGGGRLRGRFLRHREERVEIVRVAALPGDPP